MLKKLFAVVIVGVIAKFVLDKLTKGDQDAELWAEATDTVDPGR
jgi:hypothetical protein